ncbi:MAG TPA: 3-hydroxybutyryl-CoA dehydrogenase [Chloroflexota bacterium]|nr:3-hydroxybutyryl-CoA dehydrogenase [Chloroflexota bacterium]
MEKVGVVGAGLMGSGIVETCARAGCHVMVREVDEAVLNRGLSRIQKSMATAVERGKMSEQERDDAGSRIRGTTSLEDMADRDIVIEAAVENMDIKKEVFRDLDRITPTHALLVTNSSSLSSTELGSVTKRPDKVAGLHFFNPVPVMKLVEIVRALETSDQTMSDLRSFSEKLGKTVVVARDTPGFIVNALLIPYLVDAVRMLENGIASKEDIDTAIHLGLGHPMGPLTLLDFVGLDTTLYIADIMYDEFKDPRYAAPPLLRKMVASGMMGRKSGRGFYEYGGR